MSVGHERARPSHSVPILLGILIAVAALQIPIAAALKDSDKLQTAATVFTGVFLQTVPFLALGVVLSGMIAAFVSPRVLERALPRNADAAVGVAGLAGMALPGCECSSVPIARRLMDQGAPRAAAVTFLLAAPAINPVVLVSTAVAFPGQPEVVAARFCGSLATALVMGWLWVRIGKAEWIVTHGRIHEHNIGATNWQSFGESARHDLLQSGSFLVVGSVVTAAFHVLMPPWVYDGLAGNLVLAVLVMAALAVALALCSEADAFVAASMSMLPLLPRLVFLVVGPAVDVKLFAMQVGAFGKDFAIRFSPLTLLIAIVSGSVAGLVFL